MKLRKLLEDVHLESEDNLHIMKKKHQETIQDYMDQLDAMSKTKGRSVGQDNRDKLPGRRATAST